MARNTDISNADDIIDSRDIIARLEELESEIEDATKADEIEELESEIADAEIDAAASQPEDVDAETLANLRAKLAALQAERDTFDADDLAELQAEYDTLKAFADEAADYAPDWHHGAQLIRESHFTDYCQEMLDDCGTIPRDLPAYVVIDWEATADNLRVDYTEVDFDGVTYLVR